MRVYEGGELERSTDFLKLLLEYNITMKSTGGYNSWLNVKK